MAKTVKISFDNKWLELGFNGYDFKPCMALMKHKDADGKQFANGMETFGELRIKKKR